MDFGFVVYGVISLVGYVLGIEENKIFFSFNILGIIFWFLVNVFVIKFIKI